jgi:hypothetical protein
MSEDDKLAVELLAHKDSVAAHNMQMLEDVRKAREAAKEFRDKFCMMCASGSGSYEALLEKYKFDWE